MNTLYICLSFYILYPEKFLCIYTFIFLQGVRKKLPGWEGWDFFLESGYSIKARQSEEWVRLCVRINSSRTYVWSIIMYLIFLTFFQAKKFIFRIFVELLVYLFSIYSFHFIINLVWPPRHKCVYMCTAWAWSQLSSDYLAFTEYPDSRKISQPSNRAIFSKQPVSIKSYQ